MTESSSGMKSLLLCACTLSLLDDLILSWNVSSGNWTVLPLLLVAPVGIPEPWPNSYFASWSKMIWSITWLPWTCWSKLITWLNSTTTPLAEVWSHGCTWWIRQVPTSPIFEDPSVHPFLPHPITPSHGRRSALQSIFHNAFRPLVFKK